MVWKSVAITTSQLRYCFLLSHIARSLWQQKFWMSTRCLDFCCWILLPYNAQVQGILSDVVRNHNFHFKMAGKCLGPIHKFCLIEHRVSGASWTQKILPSLNASYGKLYGKPLIVFGYSSTKLIFSYKKNCNLLKNMMASNKAFVRVPETY